MTFKQVQASLHRAGWRVKNQKGGHVHFVHPRISGKITIPNHGKRDIKPGTLNAIWKHAGLVS